MKFVLATFMLSLSLNAWSWGTIGHRVVGHLADQRLTPATKAKVAALLGKETLADVANWADWIKSDPNWRHANPWHYVSIADGKKLAETERAEAGDIAQAIERFTLELKNKKLAKEKRREALAFLAHLIGDVHMPLHVGRKEDAGGNKVELKWFGRKTNLHEIWDEKIIEMEKMSYRDYAAWVDKASRTDEKKWRASDLAVWMQESQDLRDLVYSYPKDKKLPPYWEYEYRYRTYQVLNQRLLQAGVRLAAHLEKTL
ncbi:MAG: S1/P1 nuclease [Bacteriovoracia bacterium]